MRRTLPLLLLLLLSGCVGLERRVTALEEQVAALNARVPSGKFSERLGGPEASEAIASVGTWVPVEAARKSLLGARNSSGTFSLVTGNPVVTGTSISSTWANNTLSDIATEITDSLNRSGKGAMLAGLQGYVGTVSLPGYTWSGDTNTGLYWVSADDFAVAANGVKQAEFSTAGTTLGATGTPIADSYAASASLDFAGVTDSCEGLSITVTGAAVGDTCTVGTPNPPPSATSWIFCYVSAADNVVVRHCSHGASGNPAAQTYSVRVFDP